MEKTEASAATLNAYDLGWHSDATEGRFDTELVALVMALVHATCTLRSL